MNQQFEGSIGQVAGRHIKSNNAQSSVNIYIQNETKLKYISNRQRSAIARKVDAVEAKTGTDRLMVDRRLMTVFRFGSMNELPRDVFPSAMAYLDGWIRNGTAAHTQDDWQTLSPPGAGQRRRKRVEAHVSRSDTSFARLRAGVRWKTPVAVVAGSAFASIVVHFAVAHSSSIATVSTEARASRCEYGGLHYSIGSVVQQAGLRQVCASGVERRPLWQPLVVAEMIESGDDDVK
jgi:hypothetical protein